MHTQNIIEKFLPSIIQIAAPFGNGTGFYIKEFDVIITNYHVVEGVAEVTIKGHSFAKTLTSVWYTDKKHDLAFLQPPENISLGEIVKAPKRMAAKYKYSTRIFKQNPH